MKEDEGMEGRNGRNEEAKLATTAFSFFFLGPSTLSML
jgi:hypothetical protein